MIFSCEQCLRYGAACDDCVVPLFCGATEQVVLTAGEQQALQALAGEELVPPLRLLRTADTTQPLRQLAG
ncbi:MAG: hypothetical protein LBJ43_01275 [Propionibacteriaceae bacterium]|nr:hypothetical protein [Propionibacteriaceae bacterium]